MIDLTTSQLSPAFHGPVLAPNTARPAIAAKVLHVVNGEHYAGAERVQDLLALTLPQFGFATALACVKPGQFVEARQSQSTRLLELPMRSRLDLANARRLAAIVREESYDLIHTHTPRSALVGRLAARLAGVPVVHHLHSPTACDTTHRLRNWLNAASERLCLTGVDAVIAVSESLRRYGVRIGVAAEKIEVAPNGVPAREPLRPRSPPRDGWTLGCVALHRPRKGLDILLAALAALKSGGLPVRLRAIGSFETPCYETQVKSLASRLEINDLVEWRGFASDVNQELNELDLLVLPSLFGEGMPMVVLEAMAAGVPVIGTDVEGVPEVIRDGLEGLIVPPGDARALARAIERFVSGGVDWLRMRRAAHRRQVENFSDRAMAARVAEVYRRVLGLKRHVAADTK